MSAHHLPNGVLVCLHPDQTLTDEETAALVWITDAACAREQARRAALTDDQRAAEDTHRDRAMERLRRIRDAR